MDLKSGMLAALGVGSAALAMAADAPKRLEELFPAEVKGIEVKRAPITAEQRAYLRTFRVSDETLDLYADVYVKGYGAEPFRWGDVRPDDHGPLKVAFDTTGLRPFTPLPPAGQHPRLFFTDADRAEHRERLENTTGGKEAMKILMAYTELLKGSYDTNAAYASPDTWKGSFGGVHGFLPLFRAGNRDGRPWRAHVAGKPDGDLNLGLCALEAYRCWLHEDADGARSLGKAVETAVRAKLATLKPGERPGVGSFNLNFVYDFVFNWLTPEQRDLFRRCIIADNFDNNQYGCFHDAISTTSNWASFSYRLLAWLAIEGDPGFNRLQYLGYVRGMHNFLSYGWFKTGDDWEGMGKNQVGGEILYAMARRGDLLAGHPHLLAFAREFMPHAIVPWGGEFVAYDLLGGVNPLNANDIEPLKCLYPDDKRIDWVYRNCVREDYGWKHGDTYRVDGYVNNSLFAILFTVSYDPANNDPARLMDSETFFGGQRGLMITRSDWGKDALYLHHHCRGASGGHTFSDRNSFLLAGKGRVWIPNGSRSPDTHEQNVVTIDGRDIPHTSPGRMIDFKRTPLATFSCGDAAPAWNWVYDGSPGGPYTVQDAAEGKIAIPAGWEKNTFTFNDFAYDREARPDLTMPYFERPSWIDPGKIMASIRKRSEFQVKRAFRTVGMVRGKYPYALIVDDIEAADGASHEYQWIARLARDVMVWKATTYAVAKDGKPNLKPGKGERLFTDIHLVANGGTNTAVDTTGMTVGKGTPLLLVRFLQKAGERQGLYGTGAVAVEGMDRRLVVSTRAVSPEYKVLLYAYRHGVDPEPVTAWDKAGKTLTVTLRDQADTVAFQAAEGGRTAIEIRRAGGGGEASSFVFGERGSP